jgi:ammonia channel protein AmtB
MLMQIFAAIGIVAVIWAFACFTLAIWAEHKRMTEEEG